MFSQQTNKFIRHVICFPIAINNLIHTNHCIKVLKYQRAETVNIKEEKEQFKTNPLFRNAQPHLKEPLQLMCGKPYLLDTKPYL